MSTATGSQSPTIAPYGSWKSPITTDALVSSMIGLGQLALDGETLYWVEGRPSEGGRQVVVRRNADGSTTDITPAPFNVRTRAHEYGGRSYAVAAGTLYFSNFSDQRVYRQQADAAPEAITPEGAMRYADHWLDPQRQRLLCVREDHSAQGQEATNTIVSLRLDGPNADGGQVLVSGANFYSAPRLSPDGARMTWLTWNHPNMPWDGCELWMASVDAQGGLSDRQRIAGGAEESIFQPDWSPDGTLYFVSDKTNWWNLYRYRDGQIEALHPMEAEFGTPLWVFGMRMYGFVSATQLLCVYEQKGDARLALLETASGAFTPLDLPYTQFGGVLIGDGVAYFVAGAPTSQAELVQLDLATRATTVLKRSSTLTVDPAYLSSAEAIEYPTEHGLTAHAFFYRPRNTDFVAPQGERPPAIVMIHGGPTAATSSVLNLGIQYWTSRGFAMLDVNYGGSSGYGREYRNRLNGEWGVVDLDDCVNGVKYLAERDDIDGKRLIITGGSAGGYTTLAALTFRDVFQAGSSLFGISDLEVFAGDTHKFESRYMDRLIGPFPERKDLYYQRSPINFLDHITAPVILFQGADDKVVPPNQAELIVDALREKKLPVAYLLFEGEGHGFRKAENIKRTLEASLYFYARVFGFTPADAVEPVQIDNL